MACLVSGNVVFRIESSDRGVNKIVDSLHYIRKLYLNVHATRIGLGLNDVFAGHICQINTNKNIIPQNLIQITCNTDN